MIYAKRVEKALATIPAHDVTALRRDFAVLASDPYSRQVDVKKLQPKDLGQYRLRVRRWRAIFELDQAHHRILVLAVDDRRDVY